MQHSRRRFRRRKHEKNNFAALAVAALVFGFVVRSSVVLHGRTPSVAMSAAAASASASAAAASASAAAAAPLSIVDNLKKQNNFEVWVQDCMIRLYLQPHQSIAELYCGGGIALARLMVDLSAATPSRSGENAFLIERFLAVDADTNSAKNKWITKDMPFSAEFVDADPACTPLSSLPAVSSSAGKFDVVASFKSLNRAAGSRESLRCLLRNASELLRIDGLFVGTMFDPAVVWYKILKRERESGGKPAPKPDPELGVVAFGPGYKLDFPKMKRYNAPMDPFTPAMKFYMHMLEPNNGPSKNHPPSSAFLLHAPSLVAEAKELGLELVQMQNCLEFHQEYGSIAVFADSFKKLNITTKHSPLQLTPAQSDLYSLFSTFAFRKVANAPPPAAAAAMDLTTSSEAGSSAALAMEV